MKVLTFGRISIAPLSAAFAALILMAAACGPAAAGGKHHHHRYHHGHHHHQNSGFFSFQFGTPGYYAPRGYYYVPKPSVRIVIPLGKRH
jgi:hypothetical protein